MVLAFRRQWPSADDEEVRFRMPAKDTSNVDRDNLRRLVELSDLRTPWSIYVVATLRIADHIAAGVERIDDLAEAAGCDPGYLGRVLGHLVSQGVFHQPTPGRFTLNDKSEGLLDPSLRPMLDLNGFGGRMASAWGTLLTAVRTGQSAYHEAFGLSFWEDMEAHPAIAASVEAAMRPRGGRRPDPEVLLNGDWTEIRTVVDVGGGTGALLAEILRTHPEVRGTLIDFPQTVARSGETFQAADVAERVTTIGQSFFDPLLAGADLYLLRNVLSVCPDRAAVRLLSRCAEAARPTNRIVILGGVSPDRVTNGLSPEMVLVGGKERTLAEFEKLAHEAGLEVRATGRQPSGVFVVECFPAGHVIRPEKTAG